MSIIDKVFGGNDGRTQSAKTTPAMVKDKLAVANETLRQLHLKYAPASFRAEETDDPADLQELATLNTAITSAESRIRSLGVALVEAQRVEQLQQHIAAENTFQARSHAMSQFGAAMKAAAVDLEVAIHSAADAWRKLIIARDKFEQANPATLENNTIPSANKLAQFYEAECFAGADFDPQIVTATVLSLPNTWGRHAPYGSGTPFSEAVAERVTNTMAAVKADGVVKFGD
jgi:hypothetical protein